MKNFVTAFFFSIGLLLSAAAGLSAHSLHVGVHEGHAVTIETRYGDEEAMKYGEVKIFAPGNSTLEYQKGRTDAEGRFAFVPSKKGDWKIEVSDGMGHRAVKTIIVNSDLKTSSSRGAGFTMIQKIIMVLIFFWGAAGAALFFRRKK